MSSNRKKSISFYSIPYLQCNFSLYTFRLTENECFSRKMVSSHKERNKKVLTTNQLNTFSKNFLQEFMLTKLVVILRIINTSMSLWTSTFAVRRTQSVSSEGKTVNSYCFFCLPKTRLALRISSRNCQYWDLGKTSYSIKTLVLKYISDKRKNRTILFYLLN